MEEYRSTAREAVRGRLEKDLGQLEEIDVRSAVLCGEMGCAEMADFISRHRRLRCPYMGRVEDPEGACRRLREEYQAAIAGNDRTSGSG